MNTGLKNKLLVMATAAGLAGFGVACAKSSSEAPAAEEGATPETTSGAEATPGGDTAAPETTEGPAAAPGAAAHGEGSCGEGKCS